ncbi:MAG: hypothetical protein VYC00_01570 [Candidatus Neomarinimicrobiota bacterium]|mgnify:FL=1|nr:hypothetical protein [Candidatus Neomarinimicrobiota bacterium]|tara:strand:- start:157 stop:678 length:522 start_codon:yes stop_codon:yes gene_type:complete
MKKIFPFVLFLFVGCSSEPVDMDAVLYDRSGQYITGDNYSDFFFYNQKVYNGPAFNLYRSGEKREEGRLKNGFKSEVWTGFYRSGKKKFSGEYVRGKAYGKWTGYHENGQKKYEGVYELGFQTEKWIYYDEKGQKNLEETYYVCNEACKDEHPPDRRGVAYICEKLGKQITDK